MSFITGLALRRNSVTILVIVLVLAMGVFVFNNMQKELFPEIEFPNITIITFYPDANPRAVERDVSEPIEDAITGIDGLKEVKSTSSESISVVLATFEFGGDMEEAERTIESNIGSLRFPDGVEDSVVSRINSDTFPVMQLTILGDRNIPSLQRVLDDLILPPIERVDGVFRVDVVGKSDEQVHITVDNEKLKNLGIPLGQVAAAISQNNTSFPAGDVVTDGRSFTVRTTHEFRSLQEIRNLVVGFESNDPIGFEPPPDAGGRVGARGVRLSDVADITISTSDASSISRTNGKPSLSLLVLKDPEGNTVEVAEAIVAELEELKESLPADIEILELSNDGPEVQEQLVSLVREGTIGFFFAVLVVFLFLLNIRPTLLKGIGLSLRPTVIIGISIPLSLLTGVLFLGALTDITLNFMTLAGLAIAVGRVVDDSIVVLENVHRHIQRGDDRYEAAFEGTREVGAAIVSSTLTTIVVFLPLGFIEGLVGSFFSPFAMSVSYALAASTVVALTAVPVLGAILLRPGDIDATNPDDDGSGRQNAFFLRSYMPMLLWSLRHKGYAILSAIIVTGLSTLLIVSGIIPVTFFPAGDPEFLTVDLELPIGTSVARTFEEVLKIESVLQELTDEGIVTVYQGTIGGATNQFGPGGGTGGMNIAGYFVRLDPELSKGSADRMRESLPGGGDVSIKISEISGGPPSDALEITVTGNNFSDVATAAKQLEADLSEIDGIINLTNDVSDAKDEVVVNVDPRKAAEFGLNTLMVGQQVNQFIVGRRISEIDLEGVTMDIVLRGQPELADDINKIKSIDIQGPMGGVNLGSISDVAIEVAPVSISRFDGERSASITGAITAENTQAIGILVQEKIDALEHPPGVGVQSGGIFTQIAEGFQDVFLAMVVGIILVYLVMVATLGSLRNPFIIVLSLPLAIVGAFVALAVTGRTLSLSALMGFLLLIGVVVTNAIVMITFVEQLREQGLDVYDALVEGARVRLRPILMTAFTTTFALIPLAVSGGSDGGIIGAELATVVIGGLISSTFLTLIVVPVVYTFMHVSLPGFFRFVWYRFFRRSGYSSGPPISGQPGFGDD